MEGRTSRRSQGSKYLTAITLTMLTSLVRLISRSLGCGPALVVGTAGRNGHANSAQFIVARAMR
jgi:hypothetical protein